MTDSPKRKRSRYAPSKEIQRAFRLAKESGITPTGMRLGADGSIDIWESRCEASKRAEDDPEEALAAWKAKFER